MNREQTVKNLPQTAKEWAAKGYISEELLPDSIELDCHNRVEIAETGKAFVFVGKELAERLLKANAAA